jgi:Biotin-protein ligase, N terminal
VDQDRRCRWHVQGSIGVQRRRCRRQVGAERRADAPVHPAAGSTGQTGIEGAGLCCLELRAPSLHVQAVVTIEICLHSALHAIMYLILVLFAVMEVKTLGTADLLAGSWRRQCLMLVMPGGADLPYCRHLNGAGNDLISGGTLSMSSMKRHLLEVASMSVRSAGDCSNNAT